MDHSSNLSAERTTFLTHLECSSTGSRYEPDRLHSLSDTGHPLLARYDLEALAGQVTKETLAGRPPGHVALSRVPSGALNCQHRFPGRGDDSHRLDACGGDPCRVTLSAG